MSTHHLPTQPLTKTATQDIQNTHSITSLFLQTSLDGFLLFLTQSPKLLNVFDKIHHDLFQTNLIFPPLLLLNVTKSIETNEFLLVI